MAFPTVAAVAGGNDTADGTSHTVALPAPAGGILANDILLAVVAFDQIPTVGWPAGWTEIKEQLTSDQVTVAVAWKRAAGGESGNITVTTSTAQAGGWQVYCIRGAHTSTAPAISTGASGTSANPDPDVLDPAGWGAEDTLWIAAGGSDGDRPFTAAPTNYTNLQSNGWANTAGAFCGSARRALNAASEDPGTFTISASENWVAYTVAIRPAPSDQALAGTSTGSSTTAGGLGLVAGLAGSSPGGSTTPAPGLGVVAGLAGSSAGASGERGLLTSVSDIAARSSQ